MTDAGSPMTGVVTFLFTDIEGSTRLELALGTARYATVRERHRELLRAAFASNGGTEQSTQGDSFFVLFEERPVGDPCRHRGSARARARAVAGRHRGARPDGAAFRRGDGHGRRRRRLRRQSSGAHRGGCPWRPDRGLGHGASTRRRRFRWRLRAARSRRAPPQGPARPRAARPGGCRRSAARSSRRSIRSTPGRTICRPS